MTIVALSTPRGFSGIAVIRVSGESVKQVVHKFLLRKNSTFNFFPSPKKVTLAKFVDLSETRVIDQVQYVFYESPHSYTGEDLLEIFPHGNPLIIDQIMTQILSIEGTRLAEPGEFTRIALENGKIDLLQAEAIDQLIHGQTQAAISNASSILMGKLSNNLSELKKTLDKLSMSLELEVDFVEEELEPNYKEWEIQFDFIYQTLKKIEMTWEHGKKLTHSPTIGLFGKPNAGKSSLINSILGHDRLLVSEVAGTTRDYVEIPIQTQRGVLKIIDTAGIGDPRDLLDQAAMKKSLQIWDEMDFRIWVYDGRENPANQLQQQKILDPQKINLKVATRKDLPNFEFPGNFSVNNKSEKNQDIEELLKYLSNKLLETTPTEDEVLLSTQRQYHCIVKARQCIENALVSLKEKPRVEILAFEARVAVNHLKELIGEYRANDILNQIFSNFCIGK